jgi:hypothetical protein
MDNPHTRCGMMANGLAGWGKFLIKILVIPPLVYLLTSNKMIFSGTFKGQASMPVATEVQTGSA